MEQPIALHLAFGMTPATCAALACALSAIGAVRANRTLEVTGALVALIGVATFWVARASGLAGLPLMSELQGASAPSLATHQVAGTAATWVSALAGVGAGASLIASGWRRDPAIRNALALASAVLLLTMTATSIWMIDSGLRIRHPELRMQPSPPAQVP